LCPTTQIPVSGTGAAPHTEPIMDFGVHAYGPKCYHDRGVVGSGVDHPTRPVHQSGVAGRGRLTGPNRDRQKKHVEMRT
jgi:hypothetical protein|tara:strand:- start:168 stop:404 length:237 start_codon:yes stop_codon:yes gene_type:complete